MTFTVTKQWIHDNKTTGGSWNAKQLKCLGISWPAPKGWINRITGTEIPIAAKDRFEHLAAYKAKGHIERLEARIAKLEQQMAMFNNL